MAGALLRPTHPKLTLTHSHARYGHRDTFPSLQHSFPDTRLFKLKHPNVQEREQDGLVIQWHDTSFGTMQPRFDSWLGPWTLFPFFCSKVS